MLWILLSDDMDDDEDEEREGGGVVWGVCMRDVAAEAEGE